MKREASSGFLAVASLWFLASTADAQWPGPTTQPEQLVETNPISCQCSDANPRDGVYYNVTYTCLQQLIFGSCSQSFITNSVKELSEGYCQITCGRCSCCTPLATVLQNKNANTLLQAAQLAGLDKQLAAPASMFTLLAPTDEAFAAALPDLGGSLQSIPAAQLQALLSYHIILPHPGIDAVWTTPFLEASDGADIDTAIPNAPLTFEYSGGNLMVRGANRTANIIESDVEACKSYINIIDEVLIPPSGAQAAPLPISAGNTAAAFGPAPSIAEQAEAAQGFAPTAGISTVGK